MVNSDGSRSRCFTISLTALPFSNSAPGRADVHALAATCAAIGRAPGLCEVGDDLSIGPPPHDIPGVCPLDLVADADAARAQDAAVVIDGESLVWASTTRRPYKYEKRM